MILVFYILRKDLLYIPDSICRHVDQEAPLKLQGKTVASVITYPKEQKMCIANGNPCENEYIV